MADLVIKINGDISNFKKALSDVESQTENLSGSLESMAKASGLAFAALTAEVGFSVKAYAGQEEATNKLTQSLANQGIYSKQLVENYRAQASALQELTGADDDSIIKGQAVVQGYLGQIQVTKELTAAVVDFSKAQGVDLETAFQIVGKSIGTNTNALARHGIEIDVNATKQQKLEQVIAALNTKFQGQAQASTEGLGAIKLLGNAFDDLQKAIGSRFAPVVEAAARGLTAFINNISENKPLVDFIVSLTSAGLVVTGLIAGLSAAGVGLLSMKAALTAMGIAAEASTIAVRGLIGATGLGLLVLLVTEIYLNWSEAWPRMQAIFQAFVENIGALGTGLADILKGVFTFDGALITQGIQEAKDAFTTGFDEYKATVLTKKQELNDAEIQQEKAKQQEMNRIIDEAEAQRLAKAAEITAAENGIRKSKHDKEVQDIANQNVRFVDMQKKHGTAVATLDKALNSQKLTEFQSHADQMAGMQQSQNGVLKGIGKAAAISQITIETARAAMAIFTWFSETIPIVGPVLGAAAAGAAIAFGGEQIGKVLGANQGGLITGGVPGLDSVPAMLTPGELVIPAQNFEEVVSSVSANREGGTGAGAGGPIEIVLRLKDNLVEYVEAGIVERQNLNVSLIRA